MFQVLTLSLYVVAMGVREIVMGLFVCQTLPLFFEKLLEVVLLSHLFNTLDKTLFFDIFGLL